MKRGLSTLIVVSMFLLAVSFVSAEYYVRPCESVDLCTWTTVEGNSLLLPLGSDDLECGLGYNTEWPAALNDTTPTFASAKCVFDGNLVGDVMLALSVDNDILSCTLNGEEIIGLTEDGGCAPLDPRNGLTMNIASEVKTGENVLICNLKDRGSMTHFDACVTGVKGEEPVIIPEFGLFAGLTAIIGALGAFFIVRRK